MEGMWLTAWANAWLKSKISANPKVLNPDEESVSFSPPALVIISLQICCCFFPLATTSLSRYVAAPSSLGSNSALRIFPGVSLPGSGRACEQRRRRTDVVHGAGQSSTWCFVLQKRGCGERALRPPICHSDNGTGCLRHVGASGVGR